MIRRIKPVSRIIRVETETDSIEGGILVQESELLEFPQSWTPAVDVFEKGDKVVVEIEVPGIPRKNLRIWHYGNHIEIRGIKREALKEGQKQYLRLERAFGSFRRVVFLPSAVSSEKTAAYLENGILTVVLRKKRNAENRPGGGHGQRR